MHFAHGPIDLIIGAEGETEAVRDAHAAAWTRFQSVLPELVGELRLLRTAVGPSCPLHGLVARRMWHACAPYRCGFITPMAAVAGAVADEVIAHYRQPGIARAWVNNGGDIAVHLAPGARVRVGIVTDPGTHRLLQGQAALDAGFAIEYEDAARGIATSGWRGRSFSMGIADSVTVLADTAADADAAATVIANAVNVDHALIERSPANALKDDTDLGDRLVTTHVPPLPPETIAEALFRGLQHAIGLKRQGLIREAALFCQGEVRATAGTRQISSTQAWPALNPQALQALHSPVGEALRNPA